MADISEVVEQRLEIKRFGTFEKNLALAQKTVHTLTGFEGKLDDSAATKKYFDSFRLEKISAHGIQSQGVAISYKWQGSEKEAAAPRVTRPHVGGSYQPNTSYSKW